MRLRVAFTRLAKLDLDDLIVYIGEENPRAAVDVSARILDQIALLRDHPEIGRIGRRPETRELVVQDTRYIVAYRVDAARSQVQILRILHSARMWPDKL